jgi:diguanylate cyclase (GGDEF)-like protein
VLDINRAVLQFFGFSDKAEFMAQIPSLMRRGPDDVFIAELEAIAAGKTEFDMEGPNDLVDGLIRYHHVRWTVAPGYENDFRRVIVTVTDVTERRQAEERMRYLSTHDVLTGLYNRNFFEAEMERLQNSRLEPINVMVVDVNGMKSTNDTFGHAAGDELLRRTAQVLRMSFRKEDVIARIGGDEFVVLFQGTLPLLEAIKRVKDCENEHNHWYDGPPLSLAIGASTGGKGSSLVELFKRADQQMYKEKVHTGRLRPVEKIEKDEKDDKLEEKSEVKPGKFPQDH